MIFKGSYPSLNLQECILQYLGTRIHQRTQNSSVSVIFDVQPNYQKFENC